MWLWVGGAGIVLGGIVALWPVRRRGPSPATEHAEVHEPERVEVKA